MDNHFVAGTFIQILQDQTPPHIVPLHTGESVHKLTDGATAVFHNSVIYIEEKPA